MFPKLKISKPIIIVGCPRSGTSLLFRILSSSNHLWSLYRESNDIWAKFYKVSKKEFNNETLTEKDLSEEVKQFLLKEFHTNTFNNYPIGYLTREYFLKKKGLSSILPAVIGINAAYKNLFVTDYRFIEKTPKNCFRISFLNKLFDNCRFIFLKRDGRSNINSLIEGWKQPGTYIRQQAKNISLNIKGYEHKEWKFIMPPGWENYTNSSLEEVCAFQWISSNKAALEGFKSIEPSRVHSISYEDLSDNTFEVIKQTCDFIDIPFDGGLKKLSEKPPLVNYVTKPSKDKWKKNISMIENVYPMIEPMMSELGYPLKRRD